MATPITTKLGEPTLKLSTDFKELFMSVVFKNCTKSHAQLTVSLKTIAYYKYTSNQHILKGIAKDLDILAIHASTNHDRIYAEYLSDNIGIWAMAVKADKSLKTARV